MLKSAVFGVLKQLAKSPQEREALKATEAIAENFAKWDEALIDYANRNGQRMEDILNLFRQNRQMLSGRVPGFILNKAEGVIVDLANKQNSSRGRGAANPGRPQSSAPASNRVAVRLLPINK